MKHFNQGNVWGRVAGIKEEKSSTGSSYIAIQIECPNEMYGNVKTYGRLWGNEKIKAFLDHFKKHPGTVYRFRGLFSQYDKEEGMRYSNYTFFSWEPVEGKEYRASFILVGEVTKTEELEEDGLINLHLCRRSDGYKDIEEDFIIYTLTPAEITGIKDGDIIEVKGLLRAREPEDYFGKANGQIKPYAMDINVRQPADGEKGPF